MPATPVKARASRFAHDDEDRSSPQPRKAHSKSPAAKKKLLVPSADFSPERVNLLGEEEVETADDPLALYRAAAESAKKASTDSDRSTIYSSKRGASPKMSFDSKETLLRKIFSTMDVHGSGVVQMADVTRMIAMAHASGSITTSRGAASPLSKRNGSTRPSPPTSPRSTPSVDAVRLVLPDEFTLEVWLSEMTRMASAMEPAHFEANVLGLFECFRDDSMPPTPATGAAAAPQGLKRTAAGGDAGAWQQQQQQQQQQQHSVPSARRPPTAPTTALGSETSHAGGASSVGGDVSSALGFVPSYLDAMGVILVHADVRCAGTAPQVCKAWREAVFQLGDGHWRVLCQRLRDEAMLYVPADGVCPSTEGWQSHFKRLWPQRHTWGGAAQAEATSAASASAAASPSSSSSAFNVSVAVRFRPAVATAGGAEQLLTALDGEEGEETVTIPLHQKVAMVRAKRGCSHAQAMKFVMKQEQKAKDRRSGMAKLARGGGGGGGGVVGGVVMSGDEDTCVVAAAARPSDTARQRHEARLEAAAAAHVAAAAAPTRANSLAEARKQAYRGRRKGAGMQVAGGAGGSGEGAAAADGVAPGALAAGVDAAAEAEKEEEEEEEEEEEVQVFVTAFRGMPASADEEMVRRFFDRAFAKGGKSPGKRRALQGGFANPDALSAAASGADQQPIAKVRLLAPEAEGADGKVCGFLEFRSASEAQLALGMNRCDAYGDCFGDCLVEVFRTTPGHMHSICGLAASGAPVGIDKAEAAERMKDEEGERLLKIRQAREARAAEKERHKADAAALREANEEFARERRAAERAAEMKARLEAQQRKTPEELEEERQVRRTLFAHRRPPPPTRRRRLPLHPLPPPTPPDDILVLLAFPPSSPSLASRPPPPPPPHPQRAREEAAHQGKASIISINPEKTEVLAMAPSVGLRPFAFARVFEPDSPQAEVYERCGRAAVCDLLNGQSGCIIVYGQTGETRASSEPLVHSSIHAPLAPPPSYFHQALPSNLSPRLSPRPPRSCSASQAPERRTRCLATAAPMRRRARAPSASCRVCARS